MQTTHTEEFFFRSAIEADHTDSAARLLFADWFEERGDARGAGYRWMSQHDKHPFFLPESRKWSWTNLRNAVPVHNHLPPDLYDALPQQIETDWKKYLLEHEAEEELARTIGRQDGFSK